MEISNAEVAKIKELKKNYEALIIEFDAQKIFYVDLLEKYSDFNKQLKTQLSELREEYLVLQTKKKKFSILEWLLQK